MKSELSELMKSRFPGLKFLSGDLKIAGKKLKLGPEAAAAYLEGKGMSEAPNVRPPAFCDVVGKSRPFEEWPIYRASVAVQEVVYAMTGEELESMASEKYTSAAWHEEWGNKHGVDGLRESTVQGANLILKNAINRYKGVLKKVENRNKKAQKKHEARTKEGRGGKLALESAFKEDGTLVNPPGIDKSIRLFQSASLCAVGDPEAVIRPGVEGRMSIKVGERGHVPEWQRSDSAPRSKRRKKWYSARNYREDRVLRRIEQRISSGETKDYLGRPLSGKADEILSSMPGRSREASERRAEESILMKVKVGKDWATMDARGLLRNARWRGLVGPEGVSLKDLMGLFSADPVIDPVRGTATILYKEGVVKTVSKKPVSGKKTKEALEAMVESGPIALVSCDLGQTNIVAARTTVVELRDGSLFRASTGTFGIGSARKIIPFPTKRRQPAVLSPEDELSLSFRGIRDTHDRLEDELLKKAISSLSPEMRDEVAAVEASGPNEAREELCRHLRIRKDEVDWSSVGPGTRFVADILEKRGDVDLVTEEGRVLWDKSLARKYRRRLSEGTRKALNEALWEEKRRSPEYARLSRRQKEVARATANFLIRSAKQMTGCDRVVLNVEDLNMSSSFFHGAGRSPGPGWDNMFGRKKENRWFIRAIHKAITDLPGNRGCSGPRGVLVLETDPRRTSITCPECGLCDPGNRSGERFLCQKCGHSDNADYGVATRNIETVALTGSAMPHGERSGSPRGTPASRRTRKPGKAATSGRTEVGSPESVTEENLSRSGHSTASSTR